MLDPLLELDQLHVQLGQFLFVVLPLQLPALNALLLPDVWLSYCRCCLFFLLVRLLAHKITPFSLVRWSLLIPEGVSEYLRLLSKRFPVTYRVVEMVFQADYTLFIKTVN